MADIPGHADWATVRVEIRCHCLYYVIAFSDSHETLCPRCGQRWRVRYSLDAQGGARVWVTVQEPRRLQMADDL